MRYGLALPAALLGVFAVAPAHAAPTSEQSVAVTGLATARCSLSAPSPTGTTVNFDAPVGATFSITELSDPGTLSTRAANITLAFPAMCNSVHRVSLTTENNGLWRDFGGPAAAGFGNAVPYGANLVWAGEQHLLTADATGRHEAQETVLVPEPTIGEMLVEIDVSVGATNATTGAPLLAGDYADVLRLTVEPQ